MQNDINVHAVLDMVDHSVVLKQQNMGMSILKNPKEWLSFCQSQENNGRRKPQPYLWIHYLRQRRQGYKMEKDNLFKKWC